MSIKTLAARLEYAGGDRLGRINKQKLRSLQAALKNDYNSRLIKTPLHSAWPALINTNNLKPDYDKKILSVEFAAGLEAGDVFEVLDDKTHWMVYLPVLTETAYLQSEIIRCRYTLTIGDEVYWIYFQGPTETDLRWFIKRGINVNELNLSGTIYIKNTPSTRAFFERFTHIKVDNHIWEVQVTDSISVPGILELEVQEYYDNPIAELPEIVHEGEEEDIIVGETTVKQDTVIGYYIPAEYIKSKYKWEVLGNPRVKIKEIMSEGNVCKVRVYDGAVGTYTVKYGDYTLDVSIDWKREYIKGPDTVFPYDTYIYKAKGLFAIDNTDVAKIISQDGTQCVVEIITGKKGEFTLYCKVEEGDIRKLPIKIESFTGGGNAEDIGVVG